MRVRLAAPGDWEVVRNVRLRALADSPAAFSSTYDREVAFPKSVWLDRLSANTNATFVCEDDGRSCGMVGFIADTSDAGLGSIVAMWCAPSARGNGVADLLIRSALQWANDRNITTVRLHVAEGNVRAERFYARHGFNRTGERFTRPQQGLTEIEMERSMGRDKP